jgi:hypothetical protein
MSIFFINVCKYLTVRSRVGSTIAVSLVNRTAMKTPLTVVALHCLVPHLPNLRAKPV